MRLKRLTGRNVNQHKTIDLEFPLGTIGIFGPNGSGKSNLMKAAYANLTNDFRRNPGTKSEHIRDGMPDDQQSFIEGVWEHSGTEFRVLRSLSPEKNKLWVPGQEKPITNANEITSTLEGLLQCSRHVLDNYVFIDQQQISGFLTAKPSERAEVFAHLCQTIVAAEIHKLIGEAITRDSNLAEPVAVDLDAARQAYQTEKNNFAALKAELASSQEGLLKPKVAEKAQKFVAARQLYKQRVDDLAEKRTTRVDGYNKVLTAMTALQQQEIAFKDRAAMVDGLRQVAEAARTSLSLIQELSKQGQRKTWLQAEIARLTRTKKTKPVKPKITGGDGSLRERIAELRMTVTENERFVEHFNSHATNCPTCEHELDDPAALLRKAKAKLKAAKPALQEAQDQLDALDAYIMDISAYQTWEAGYEAVLKSRQDELEQLKDVTYSADDEAKFKQSYNRYTTKKTELDALAKTLEEARQRYNRLEGSYAAAKKAHVAAKALVAECEVSDEDYESALEMLAQHTAAKSASDRCVGQLDLATKLLDAAKKEYDRVKAVLERGKAARKYLGVLDEIRPLFHLNMLPRIVHEGYLGEIVERLNENLEDFDSPFRISRHEGLTLYYKKRRAKEREAAWLSVGERVVLALAFRIAVSSIFAKDVGMLVLDEPTEGLDIHNMDCLETALLRLAQISKARGYQIIMITHETRLEKVFDHVIRIAA